MALLPLVLYACGDDGPSVGVTGVALTVECAPEVLPSDAWVCSEPLTVECAADGADPQVLYVEPGGEGECDGELNLSDPGPFGVGVHDIEVTDEIGAQLCSTTLTVQDTQPPVIEQEHTLSLWPPNHKLHAIDVDDCVSVSDACDDDDALSVEFIWASSDEPIDDIGDGHHAPDIVIDDCETVSVRAERQGPRDGRVYRLGVRVTDASGNSTEGACTVLVDHDQRGVSAADSGDDYRIELDGTGGLPECGQASPVDDDAGVL